MSGTPKLHEMLKLHGRQDTLPHEVNSTGSIFQVFNCRVGKRVSWPKCRYELIIIDIACITGSEFKKIMLQF